MKRFTKGALEPQWSREMYEILDAKDDIYLVDSDTGAKWQNRRNLRPVLEGEDVMV